MMLPDWIHPVMFIGGKGGVGKTTVACALASMAARAGRRVLVVSTDPAHSLGDMFDVDITSGYQTLLPGLDGLEIDSEAEADRYIDRVKRTAASIVAKTLAGEVERQIELARHAPGAMEAALVERMARILTEDADRYDHIVFDTAPTGHAMRLITLPELLGQWAETLLGHHEKMQDMERVYDFLGGNRRTGARENKAVETAGPDAHTQRRLVEDVLRARRDLYRAAAGIMTDSSRTAFVAVATPEKLPVLEVERLLAFLDLHRMALALLVMNKILPDHLSDRFLTERKFMQARYIDRLKQVAHCAQRRIPLQETEAVGVTKISDISSYLDT